MAKSYSINPSYIYEEDIGYSTQIITMENGFEIRNSYRSPRRTFTLNYDRVTKAIYDSIIAFFTARLGRYETFDWINPNDNVTYTVRFVDDTLETEEIADEIYQIKLSLIEVV